MKKNILFIALALMMGMSSCGKKAAEEQVITVDEFFQNAPELVDTEVLVEGLCVGVCHHSGRKAFIQGTEQVLFVQAGDEMEAFDLNSVEKNIRVKGIVRSFIPEPQTEEVVESEEQPACDAAVKEDGNQCCEKEAQALQAAIIYYVEASKYEAL